MFITNLLIFQDKKRKFTFKNQILNPFFHLKVLKPHLFIIEIFFSELLGRISQKSLFQFKIRPRGGVQAFFSNCFDFDVNAQRILLAFRRCITCRGFDERFSRYKAKRKARRSNSAALFLRKKGQKDQPNLAINDPKMVQIT